MKTELTKLGERLNIRCVARYGGEIPESWPPGTHPYHVTLRLSRRSLTCALFCGPANTNEPTAADVLCCLASER